MKDEPTDELEQIEKLTKWTNGPKKKRTEWKRTNGRIRSKEKKDKMDEWTKGKMDQ